jgi:hypothetical protein
LSPRHRRKVPLPTDPQKLMATPRAVKRQPSDSRYAHRVGAARELFHTATGTAFADIPLNDHRETWPVRSKRFRSWLRRCYYQATGEAASAAEIRSALDLLEARAQFDGRRRVVHIRIAEHAEHLPDGSPDVPQRRRNGADGVLTQKPRFR